jgi:methyl-accepting chemotaxis protein
MSNIAKISPQLQTFLAAPAIASTTPAAYGLWGLGVRIMGNMQFAAKALTICLMFMVPLAWLAWTYYAANHTNIAFSAKERLGVEYNRQIFPVINLAQQLRRDATSAAAGGAPATLADVKTQLQAAQGKLAEVQKKLGADLASDKGYAAVQKAFADASSATGVDGVFKAHSEHIAALIALLTQVTDASNLTLDPDIDSYYLMDAAFFRAPDIVENSGKLRGLGLAIMKVGSVTPQQMRVLTDSIPIADFQINNMHDGFAKAAAYNSDLGAKINAGEAVEASTAYFAMVRKSLIDGKDYSPETQAAYLSAANKSLDAQYALATRVLDQLDALIAQRVGKMQTERNIVTSVLLVGLLLAMYSFYSFFLVTRDGLRTISQHLQEISEGDLRRTPTKPSGSDETAKVIVDVKKAYDALHTLIKKVRHSARALHVSSDEIAGASANLAARTEASAAALEEQASAMEEISATVKSTAERAQMASTFATDNTHVAEKGGQVFTSVTSTMRDIQSSSSKISDIISVIDGIAFQTNILALNAAVEAARAGESGRGFAVVASEVRSLAGRSAEAAREIKSLISASVEKIEQGTTVVDAAGKTMSEVVANATQINSLLAEIATAAREQALGVSEVGRSIQELDKTTQQNAALVEETTAAASSLRQEANTLQDEIANFKVA